MNYLMIRKIGLIILLGVFFAFIELSVIGLEQLSVFHHLTNGVLCLVLVTLLARTKLGVLLGLKASKE